MQGAKGGHKGTTGGTYNNPQMASRIGKIGGSRSKRGHKFIADEGDYLVYTLNSTGETVKYRKTK